jgi:hypothetical protein
LSLSNDDLATISIEIVAMDIKTGTPADSGPQFCDLYPRGEFDAMFEMVGEWPQLKKTVRWRLPRSAPDEAAYRKIPSR